MEPTLTMIIDKAARIIMNSGLGALNIPNLEKELGVDKNHLNNQLTKDDDILIVILFRFENELKGIIQEINNKCVVPEAELQLLFKELYSFFLAEPYYMALIFDKNLATRDDAVRKSIVRTMNIMKTYLATIIDAGKKDQTFTTGVSTKLLAKRIIRGFRLFMKDEHLVNDMILELKTLKNHSNDESCTFK